MSLNAFATPRKGKLPRSPHKYSVIVPGYGRIFLSRIRERYESDRKFAKVLENENFELAKAINPSLKKSKKKEED